MSSYTSSKKTRFEDYITTIYRLEEIFNYARLTDISRELGTTPGTVSKVISRLESEELVKRVRYRYVTLTEKGRAIAERVIRKHRIAELFLSRLLGFDEYESHLYAHYMEHLPEKILDRIYSLLGEPVQCPHGNKIPGVEVNVESLPTLNNAPIGRECIVKRIAGEFTSTLKTMQDLGIYMNTTLTVLDQGGDKVVVKTSDSRIINVPRHTARFIFVECR